jgi:hypothetical protein
MPGPTGSSRAPQSRYRDTHASSFERSQLLVNRATATSGSSSTRRCGSEGKRRNKPLGFTSRPGALERPLVELGPVRGDRQSILLRKRLIKDLVSRRSYQNEQHDRNDRDQSRRGTTGRPRVHRGAFGTPGPCREAAWVRRRRAFAISSSGPIGKACICRAAAEPVARYTAIRSRRLVSIESQGWSQAPQAGFWAEVIV